jgi:hypothetical protein
MGIILPISIENYKRKSLFWGKIAPLQGPPFFSFFSLLMHAK